MDEERQKEINNFLYLNSLKNGRFIFDLKEKKNIIIGIAIAVFLFTLFFAFYIVAPRNFPVNSIYNLRTGQTYSGVASDLKELNYIESEFWFKVSVAVFTFGKRNIIAGDYSFESRENVLTIAWRVSHGGFNTKSVKITLPEGLNSYEIASILENKLPFFDKTKFINLVEAKKMEGYLFPDTYFLAPSISEEEIISLMNSNYNEKIKTLSEDIKKFGKSESDIIKMASILEGEARLYETRQVVAGILWKRISIGMALQVDSSFKYINGKTSADLTIDDLKIDSPYNSYTNRGLPPTPISNPGLVAIKASINPVKTPYLYFLTDKDGNMHYASTLEEHAANKVKYLK